MAAEINHKQDRFHGIIIDVSKQTLTHEDFLSKLQDAFTEWKAARKRGVSLKVQNAHAALVPRLIEMGFDFHHAQPGYVYMTTWLPEDIPNHLPSYANHYLGVAGFVVNDQNQILTIREQSHDRMNITSWKMPGGQADAGEDLSVTARREVFEETGIDTQFVCVLAYRHMHNYRHGCSDFYQVCLMKPLTSEIKACPLEIAECKWMDLEEYESLAHEVNKFFVTVYRQFLATGQAIGVHDVISHDRRSYQKIYSAKAIDFEEQNKTNEKDSTLENGIS